MAPIATEGMTTTEGTTTTPQCNNCGHRQCNTKSKFAYRLFQIDQEQEVESLDGSCEDFDKNYQTEQIGDTDENDTDES